MAGIARIKNLRKAMRERPILMSGPMVRAILDGRKTQTRRVIKGQPFREDTFWRTAVTGGIWFGVDEDTKTRGPDLTCPYGQPGDLLWVRETTREYVIGSESMTEYLADGWAPRIPWNYSKRTRPSIFMPRKYCRLLLDVTDVRVERLHDISGPDIEAEGIAGFSANKRHVDFLQLWNSLNEKRGYGWDVNPWVWKITFKRSTDGDSLK